MQKKESPKIVHPHGCARLVSLQNQFLHTFLSPSPERIQGFVWPFERSYDSLEHGSVAVV